MSPIDLDLAASDSAPPPIMYTIGQSQGDDSLIAQGYLTEHAGSPRAVLSRRDSAPAEAVRLARHPCSRHRVLGVLHGSQWGWYRAGQTVLPEGKGSEVLP